MAELLDPTTADVRNIVGLPLTPADNTTLQYNITTGVWEEKTLSALGLVLADITDVTISASNLNSLDDGVDSTLHFHDSDRDRSNHTGTQLASTISNFDATVDANAAVVLNTAKVTNATHTGEVTGSVGLTITADAVTYAKMQNVVADNVFLGNNSGAGSIVEELTATEATALLDIFTDALKGLVPASGGGTTNFLRADGTFAAPPGSADPLTTKGDIFGFTTVEARIPVGADDTVLIADATPALGVKYALISNINIDGSAAIAGSKINMSITELSDVAAKSGSGTTVLFQTTPTITTPTIASFVNSTHTHLNAAGGGTITKAAISDFAHQATHQSGGGDALTGLLDATARTGVSKNSAADVGARRTLNFIEGANVTLTILDDAGGEEVDITIASTAGGGSPLTTKGDVYGFDSADARIPVGTDDFVFMADAAAGLGVKYALLLNANISGSAAITFAKLENLTSGQIIVGSAGNVPTAVVMGGDVAIIAAGTTTIQTDAVTYAKMQNVVADNVFLGNNSGAGAIVDE